MSPTQVRLFSRVLRFVTVGSLLAAPRLAAAQGASPPPDHYTFLHCGHLLDVPGKDPRTNVTLVIKNDRVDSIVDGMQYPRGNLQNPQQVDAALRALGDFKEIDLTHSFVLPGLIDCHVHLTNEWDRSVRTRMVTESPEFVAVRATHYARITLEAGFTTVRDLGSASPQAIFALRDAIDQKLVVGPRIIAAGHWISMTGGHGDGTNGYRADLIPQPTPDDGIADGPEECMKAVRNQIKLGADVIKVTATGGVLSASSAGLAQHFFDDELSAIVKTAHSLGRRVAAHAHGVDGINAAIRAGVDSIEHGTYLDDQSIELFKAREKIKLVGEVVGAGPDGSPKIAAEWRGPCYHVPTLLAAQTVFDNAHTPGYYLPMVARKALLVGPQAQLMFRKSHEAGVKIAFGTDTGVSPHGQNAREFKLMVDGGMTPIEAITAATITASELLGLEKEIGTLEPGKSADIIAVSGDPLKDVTELERITFVMRAGQPIKGAR